MGKRESIATTKTELKRSKRKINSKYARPTVEEEESNSIKSEIKEEEIVDDAEIKMETEEEVVCDGEVEIYTNNDVGENIDVETADADDMEIKIDNTTPPPRPKSKNSKRTSSATKSNTNDLSVSPSSITSTNLSSTTTSANKKGKRRRDSGTSSDEERWLTAIESGKLEDVDDELKKIKDPKLMTARQRAMYERNSDRDPALPAELLMSLPIGYREREKPQTAEEIQKAVLKSQRRKQQADEKREKDKKKTMDRLLNKQETKQRGAAARAKIVKTNTPMITYITNADGASINLPADYEFPLKPQTKIDPPPRKLCGIAGCGQFKRYNCSKTNVPLCSIACYLKNVQSVKDIMC